MPRSSEPRNCAHCGRLFLATLKALRMGQGRFCTVRCAVRGTPRTSRPLLDRFLDLADQSGGPLACWPWKGSRNPQGYGRMGDVPPKRTGAAAHRVAYRLFVEPIPEGLFVLHHCDNPWCVNPRHLFLGTQQQNVDDCRTKGRAHYARGEKIALAKLTGSAIPMVRLAHAVGRLPREIAAHFGICESQVRNIVHGRAWKHIRWWPKSADEVKLALAKWTDLLALIECLPPL